MLLTDAERQRFIEWLEQDIRSNKSLAEQFAKMPHLESLCKAKRIEAMAEEVVARILRQTTRENFTIL